MELAVLGRGTSKYFCYGAYRVPLQSTSLRYILSRHSATSCSSSVIAVLSVVLYLVVLEGSFVVLVFVVLVVLFYSD